LAPSAEDLPRAVLEAVALEAYRENKLSTVQLRRLLGLSTRTQVRSFGVKFSAKAKQGKHNMTTTDVEL